MKLIMPGTTKSSYISTRAKYLENGDTTCQEVMHMVNGQLIKQMVIMVIYVNIQEEIFEMSALFFFLT